MVKEQLEAQGVSWNDAEKIIENNILDFLTSGDKKTRMYATRYFSEFIKPKKKELSGTVGMTIDDIILARNQQRTNNTDVIAGENDTNINIAQ